MSIRRSLSSLLILVAALLFQSCKEQKTGFVDMFKLVSEFELQKEYSDQARKEFDRARSAIDSAVAAERLRNAELSETLKDDLYTAFSRKTEDHNKEIEKMIWTRLNPYITEFGKEHGYRYIYGANGTGNVLYADAGEDITGDLIKYVNNRYHDKK